jgi:tetratricopeptide (TPR) repeat protein
MVHHDFGSMSSLLQRNSRDGKDRDWSAATAGYEAICRLTLEFLDTRVKAAGAGESTLGREIGSACTVSTRKAEKTPPTPRDFLELLDADGVSAAAAMIRTVAKEHPDLAPTFEGATNQAGYALLAAGRTADAVTIFTLAVEVAPASVNASDSLGEAYLAAGELDKAETCYLDAKSKLERVPDMPPETKAQYVANADRALAAIAKLRQK